MYARHAVVKARLDISVDMIPPPIAIFAVVMESFVLSINKSKARNVSFATVEKVAVEDATLILKD